LEEFVGKKRFNAENGYNIKIEEFLESLVSDPEKRRGIFFRIPAGDSVELDRLADKSGIQKTRLVVIAIRRFIEDCKK
jgi:hypothetical protein